MVNILFKIWSCKISIQKGTLYKKPLAHCFVVVAALFKGMFKYWITYEA